MKGAVSTFWIIGFSVLSMISSINGHALMILPRSRNLVAFEQQKNWCPHCLNGGGTGTVKGNDVNGGIWARNYPETDANAVRHGLCGDPAGNDEHMYGGGIYGSPSDGNVQNTYTQGGSIDITIDVRTHHHGWFEFHICDMTNKNGKITQSCLNKNQLMRDPNDPSESPIDSNFPGRYYMIPKCAPNAYMQTMRYKLPTNLVCDHCVLQWYWVTANSCYGGGYVGVTFPNTYTDCIGDGGAVGWYPRDLTNARCSETSTVYPEEFWNCADIAIVPSGSPTTPSPTSENQPSTNLPTPLPTKTPPAPQPTSDGSCKTTVPAGGDCSSTPSCCPSGTYCYRKHQYYSGCLSSCSVGWIDGYDSLPWECILLSESSTPSPTPLSNQPTPSSGTCSVIWTQCGGLEYSGQTSCCEGLKCTVINSYYHQCLADPDRTCKLINEQCSQSSDCCSGKSCIGNEWYKQCQ